MVAKRIYEKLTPNRLSEWWYLSAQTVTKLSEGDDWIYELKSDGYRALLLKNLD
jgi:ATP-dependent DNA ligase